MKRGDLVTVVLGGDLGKPRPALVIQSDTGSDSRTVIVLPITSEVVIAPLIRVTVEPSGQNGLLRRSQVMLDKITNLRREKVGPTIGTVDRATMDIVEENLALLLGIA